MSNISEDGYVVLIDDFDLTSSRTDRCSISGMRKRPDDVGVFRPIVNGQIAFEGFFDISQYAVEQMARMLGWAPPEQVALYEQALAEANDQVLTARKEAFKKAQDAVKMAGVRAAQADL